MISVAHSPDADDFFLFWPLRQGMISSAGFEFSFCEHDTQQLNESALARRFDICAISVATYPKVATDYAILPSGASIGRNYGPALVSTRPMRLAELAGKTVGVPGKTTTAALLFSKLVPDAETVEVPLTPYNEVFRRLKDGSIEAAVLIHEGQIAYEEHGLIRLADLGTAWTEKTGLPLPLGINVIRKSLGDETVKQLSELTSLSARYAFEHREEILPSLFEYTQTRLGKLKTEAELKRYLDMYANSDSVDMPPDCRKAITEMVGATEYA